MSYRSQINADVFLVTFLIILLFIFLSRPIRPGIVGQKQTFEELLEEQLRLEEQRLKSARQQQVRNVFVGQEKHKYEVINEALN